jgi:hypothetical protein
MGFKDSSTGVKRVEATVFKLNILCTPVSEQYYVIYNHDSCSSSLVDGRSELGIKAPNGIPTSK